MVKGREGREVSVKTWRSQEGQSKSVDTERSEDQEKTGMRNTSSFHKELGRNFHFEDERCLKGRPDLRELQKNPLEKCLELSNYRL